MLKDRLVAHRGYRRRYPENTLLAMGEAVAAGARFLETDIQLTRDLRPVLYHDEYLSRISGREGRIHDLDFAEAIALPAHEPMRFGEKFQAETVASLDAFVGFLESHREVTAFIEIKEEAIRRFGRQAVFDAIAGPVSAVADRAVVISFDLDFIARVAAESLAETGIVLHHWSQLEAQRARDLAPDYVFANRKLIPQGEDLAGLEPLLVVYELDRPAEITAMFDRGADMVETFDIGGVIDALAGHNL